METKYLIIGAGISGLSFAGACGGDYLIVEKEKEAGGLCRTIYQDGFVWDYAGHFFHFANPDIQSFFERQIRAEDMVQCEKKTNINYYNNLVDYPFQANIHQLPKQEFIDCLYDLFHKNEKQEYDSFEEMLYGKFGKSITEKFLKPYNEKLYACDLNSLDSDAMGRFFPYVKPLEIIDNMKKGNVSTYNGFFDYPKKGAKFFVDILLKDMKEKKLLLNTSVKSVDLEKKTAYTGEDEIHYEYLINTVSLKSFVKDILKNNDGRYNLAEKLTCNKVLVFNLGFDKPALDRSIHWSYFPDKDINFYRVGYYSNILQTDQLSMYVEIGFKEDEEVDVKKQLDLTMDSLRKSGIITGHQLISHNVLLINPAYVHITTSSMKEIQNFMKYLEDKGAYSIGRYGKWTYCSIEDCMLEARELGKKLGAK